MRCDVARGFFRDERAADGHTVAAPAILKVFAQEQGTVLKLSGGDDHRIPPAPAVTLLDVVRPQQQVAIDGSGVSGKQCAHIGPGILHGHAGVELRNLFFAYFDLKRADRAMCG